MKNLLLNLPIIFIISFVLGSCNSTGSEDEINSTTESIIGTWTGEVSQNTFKYGAVMTIEASNAGESAGTISYQFVNSTCEGDLKFDGEEGDTFIFVEENTTGGCSSPGIIKVTPQGDNILNWAWYFPEDSTPSATATLSRA